MYDRIDRYIFFVRLSTSFVIYQRQTAPILFVQSENYLAISSLDFHATSHLTRFYNCIERLIKKTLKKTKEILLIVFH